MDAVLDDTEKRVMILHYGHDVPLDTIHHVARSHQRERREGFHRQRAAEAERRGEAMAGEGREAPHIAATAQVRMSVQSPRHRVTTYRMARTLAGLPPPTDGGMVKPVISYGCQRGAAPAIFAESEDASLLVP